MTGKAIVGRAATSLVRPASPEGATPALATKHSVEMIDEAKPGEVGVIVMEGTLDIAAMGGLMGTAATVRGMAGMVLDGAVRDVGDFRRWGSRCTRGRHPRTAVGHYATVAKNVPVECAGVTVLPATSSWPARTASWSSPRSARGGAEEGEGDRRPGARMFPFIQKHKSLQKAIELFGRI